MWKKQKGVGLKTENGSLQYIEPESEYSPALQVSPARTKCTYFCTPTHNAFIGNYHASHKFNKHYVAVGISNVFTTLNSSLKKRNVLYLEYPPWLH